jgi:hypothetical protein
VEACHPNWSSPSLGFGFNPKQGKMWIPLRWLDLMRGSAGIGSTNASVSVVLGLVVGQGLA